MGTSGFDEGSEDERAKVVPFLKDDEMKKVECLRAEVVGDEEVGHGGWWLRIPRVVANADVVVVVEETGLQQSSSPKTQQPILLEVA
ncbi:hypothetical protein ACOSQ4_014120 [Xanthoceras sorbifolium]